MSTTGWVGHCADCCMPVQRMGTRCRTHSWTSQAAALCRKYLWDPTTLEAATVRRRLLLQLSTEHDCRLNRCPWSAVTQRSMHACLQ